MYIPSITKGSVFKDTAHKPKQTMCVIIIKQGKDEMPADILQKSSQINPHGLGIVWLDTYEVTYHKSTEWDLLQTSRPFIAHFRYATIGAVNKANTHPFVCGSNKDEYLMMNGTIHGMGNNAKCDSKELAESLGRIPRHKWKKELEKYRNVRFATMNVRTRTFQIYNRDLWTFRDGVWYSKDNVIEDNVVAVYGTLKRGHGNYHRYLTGSTFIGSGKTNEKYPLLVQGLPYLIEEKGVGHNVKVDVFKVSEKVFKSLDVLEGHPKWYRRKQVKIKMDNGKVITAWVYFNLKTKRTASDIMHKSYERHVPKQVYTPADTSKHTWQAEHRQLELTPLIDDDSEFDDGYYCTSCYNDLEHDGYGNYCCTGCDEWYTQNELDNLI